MAHVTIVATGGTIASRTDPESGAVVPAVGAEELVASVPALADVAEIEVVEFASVSSWDVTPQMMADLARRISAHSTETDGFVVTHGTDTMEETAFALAALLDVDVPVTVARLRTTA
jgi:L-asparaginase